MEDENRKTFKFGNERFGGSYRPGDFELRFPDDMTREEFEKIFTSKMEALHKRGNEFAEEFFDSSKSKKEKLKPLSIRVKPHTKEFFKNHSILSPRDVLEMYENFNNGSEAFINSLIEDEKQLEKELKEVQEKLHNARLFKEKLGEMDLEVSVMTDEDRILKLKQIYHDSEVKVIGNEISIEKAQNDIKNDIELYNTSEVWDFNKEFLTIEVATHARPVLYYFKNEYSKGDIDEILSHIEEYCGDNEIKFNEIEKSCFEE